MKRMMKRLLAVCLLVSLLASLTGCLLLYTKTTDNEGIEHYQQDCKDLGDAMKLLPDPTSFPDGEVVYHCRQVSDFLFNSDAVSLFVTYPEEQYPAKKEALLSDYEFLTAPVYARDGDQVIPATEFPYKTFQMKVTTSGESDVFACQLILLVGYDDAACRIVYCLFDDTDLDCIAEPGEDGTEAMQSFMDYYFYWISE